MELKQEKVGPDALVVEGGAMRGVFSCGVLDHFMAEGFSPFQSFWGVSAGATNLASYLAHMPGRNRKIYTDYSCRKQFVTPGKFLLGGDFMDLDWLWEETIRDHPVNTDNIVTDGRPLFLTLTNSTTGKAEYLRPTPENLADMMKASSAVPIFYRSGVDLNGSNYVDGGVADSIPVAEAIRRGAKRVMVLRSRPAGYRKSPAKASGLVKYLLRKKPALIEPMLSRAESYNASVELIIHPPQGVEIIEVCPPACFELKRLTRDPAPLEQGYQVGVEAGVDAILRWFRK